MDMTKVFLALAVISGVLTMVFIDDKTAVANAPVAMGLVSMGFSIAAGLSSKKS